MYKQRTLPLVVNTDMDFRTTYDGELGTVYGSSVIPVTQEVGVS